MRSSRKFDEENETHQSRYLSSIRLKLDKGRTGKDTYMDGVNGRSRRSVAFGGMRSRGPPNSFSSLFAMLITILWMETYGAAKVLNWR